MLPESELEPTPCECAEERRARRIRARACLSRRRVCTRPRLDRAPQVARSAAKGRRHQGRLFLAYLILAKQKKVSRPPRRQSGLRTHQGASRSKKNKASTGSARTVKNKFGSGRFRGRSTNSPSLRPALRVLRFACSEIVIRPQKPQKPVRQNLTPADKSPDEYSSRYC